MEEVIRKVQLKIQEINYCLDEAKYNAKICTKLGFNSEGVIIEKDIQTYLNTRDDFKELLEMLKKLKES